jgi:hypothetical protein
MYISNIAIVFCNFSSSCVMRVVYVTTHDIIFVSFSSLPLLVCFSLNINSSDKHPLCLYLWMACGNYVFFGIVYCFELSPSPEFQ